MQGLRWLSVCSGWLVWTGASSGYREIFHWQGARALAGRAVAMSSDWAAVGAPAEPCESANNGTCGAVHVFARVNGSWRNDTVLRPYPESPHSGFGWSVALTNNFLLVGAPWAVACARGNESCGERGLAHIFALGEDGSWRQRQVLQGSEDVLGFGWAVALGLSEALVGAPLTQPLAEVAGTPDLPTGGWHARGSAYLFRRASTNESWTLQHTWRPMYERPDGFGFAVALDERGDAFVGAPWDDACLTEAEPQLYQNLRCNDTGTVYWLSRGTDGLWYMMGFLKAQVPLHAHSGFALASKNRTVLVGAPNAGYTLHKGSTCGSVHVFYYRRVWPMNVATYYEGAQIYNKKQLVCSEWQRQLSDSGKIKTVFLECQNESEACTGTNSDLFGSSIALADDGLRAVVGAYWDFQWDQSTGAKSQRNGVVRMYSRDAGQGLDWYEHEGGPRVAREARRGPVASVALASYTVLWGSPCLPWADCGSAQPCCDGDHVFWLERNLPFMPAELSTLEQLLGLTGAICCCFCFLALFCNHTLNEGCDSPGPAASTSAEEARGGTSGLNRALETVESRLRHTGLGDDEFNRLQNKAMSLRWQGARTRDESAPCAIM